MLGLLQNDQALAKRTCIASVKRRVPLFVLLTKTHNHNVSLANRAPRADRVDHRTLAVMPELVGLFAQDRHAAVVRGGMIRHRGAKAHIKPLTSRNNLLTPVSMNFARKINLHSILPQIFRATT